MRREYKIMIPNEFVKDPAKKEIVGNVMAFDQESQSCLMRFRRDILTPLTDRASEALAELDACLTQRESPSTVHLTPDLLPTGTIIMMDNYRWLHARNNINDPSRHLRRLRWDAIPFPFNDTTIDY